MPLSAVLTAAEEVPPTSSGARGTGTVDVDGAPTKRTLVLTITGVSNLTSAHIHIGAQGAIGPVMFALATTSFTSPLTATFTAADYRAGSGAPASFADAVQQIVNGGA